MYKFLFWVKNYIDYIDNFRRFEGTFCLKIEDVGYFETSDCLASPHRRH